MGTISPPEMLSLGLIGGTVAGRTKKPKQRRLREYKFRIDAFAPDTMPMARLAEYLRDLAVLIGQDKSIHLMRVDEGSTVPVMLVEWEAEPKVRERLRSVKRKEAPVEAMEAQRSIDRRLAEDNASAAIVDPVGSKMIVFAGRDRAEQFQYGPFNQPGEFQGIPIKVGGEGDPVPVHLEDGQEKHIVLASRTLAKEIAAHLFTSWIRVQGQGRWMRHADGEWKLISFRASTFMPIREAKLSEIVAKLREVPAKWKDLEDPLGELEQMRRGPKIQ